MAEWPAPRPEGVAADGGLAVLAVLVTLALLTVVVASSVGVSVRESRISLATSAAAPGLYAAEAGLSVAHAAWEAGRVAGLPPGRAVQMSRGMLASGDRYEARVTRLNRLGEEAGGYHLLVSVGSVRSPRGGQRRVARLLRAPDPARWCCNAAVTSVGEVEVSGGAKVSGSDPGPTLEADDCGPGAGGGRAGALIGTTGRIEVAPGSRLEGRPPFTAVGPQLELLLAEARHAFFELAGRAGIVLPAGTRRGRIGPALDEAGDCDLTGVDNWGEPRDPGHPCAEYLPVVYARGDLTLEADGRGQGILLVEGDLEVRGDLEFDGLILVWGHLGWEEGRVRGAVLQLGDPEARVRVAAGGVFGYSGCAVQGALRSAKLVSPHPLAQFSWLEILEEG